MDIEQAALDDEFDGDNDNDSHDDGYVTGEESDEEDNVNFGIAAILFHVEI